MGQQLLPTNRSLQAQLQMKSVQSEAQYTGLDQSRLLMALLMQQQQTGVNKQCDETPARNSHIENRRYRQPNRHEYDRQQHAYRSETRWNRSDFHSTPSEVYKERKYNQHDMRDQPREQPAPRPVPKPRKTIRNNIINAAPERHNVTIPTANSADEQINSNGNADTGDHELTKQKTAGGRKEQDVHGVKNTERENGQSSTFRSQKYDSEVKSKCHFLAVDRRRSLSG